MMWVLCSCATQLPPHSADTSLPGQWRHTVADGENASATLPFELTAWWRLFAAAELDQLVARVINSNLEIREMAARVAAARALEHATHAEFQPTLRAATTPAETPDTRGAYLQVGIEATWPFGIFGRSQAAVASAMADTEMARTDVQLARSRIVAETVRAYVEWRTARAAVLNLDGRIAAQAEQTELMRARVRLRLSAPSEISTEEARLGELKSERLAIDRTVTEESERLGLLTATAGPYPFPAVADGLAPLPTPRVDSIPADLLRNRADVRHAEQAAMKAVAQLNLAQADLYPQLTLVGSLTVGLPVTGATSGATRALASVAPVIDIPLFDWGRRKAIVVAQNGALEATLLAYRQSILAGVHEVEGALGTLDSLTRDTELRRAALERAARVQEATTTAARLGRASHIDVLASALARLEAAASLARAEHSRSLAYIDLCQALGGAHPPSST